MEYEVVVAKGPSGDKTLGTFGYASVRTSHPFKTLDEAVARKLAEREKDPAAHVYVRVA